MKKKLLFVAVLCAFLEVSNAQNTLFSEDFNGNSINADLSSGMPLSVSSLYEVDGSDQVGVIDFNQNASPNLVWNNAPTLSSTDSLFVQFKIGTNYATSTEVQTLGNTITIISLDTYLKTYDSEELTISANVSYDFAVDNVITEDGYLQVYNVVSGPLSSTVNIIAPTLVAQSVTLKSITYGEFTGVDAGKDYCSARYTGANERSSCRRALTALYRTSQVAIDDVEVTDYSIITSLQKGLVTGQKELVKVYNQLGQERNPSVTGEVLIYHYNDGSVEKIYTMQ